MKPFLDVVALTVAIFAGLFKFFPLIGAPMPVSDSFIVITDDTPVTAVEYSPVPPPLQVPPIKSPEVTDLEKQLQELNDQKEALKHESDEYRGKLQDTLQKLRDAAQPPAPTTVAPPAHHHTWLEPAVKDSISTGRPLLVIFTQKTGCPFCARLTRDVLPDAQVSDYIARKFSFALIECEDHPATADQFHVKTVPAVFIYSPDDHDPKGFKPSMDPKKFLEEIKARSQTT